MKNYEIWVLGLDKNGYATDFESLIATTSDETYARQLFNYCELMVSANRKSYPKYAQLVLELVNELANGDVECEDRLAETDI